MDIRTALNDAKLQYGDMLDREEARNMNLFIYQAKDAMTHCKYEQALYYLNKAAGIQSSIRIRMLRGRCLMKLRLYEEACDDAEEILTCDERNPEALLIKAEAKYYLGNFENALICYHRGKRAARKNMKEAFRQGVRRTEEAISEYLNKKVEKLFLYPSPAFFDKNILFESYSNLKSCLP